MIARPTGMLQQIFRTSRSSYRRLASRYMRIAVDRFRFSKPVRFLKQILKSVVKSVSVVFLRARYRYRWKHVHYRTIVENSKKQADVSLLVPTYGSVENVSRLLTSLNKHRRMKTSFEVLICNDLPEKELEISEWVNRSKAVLRALNATVLTGSHNCGFVPTINTLVSHARGKYVCLLNDDIEILNAHWLDSLLSELAQPNVWVAGSLLLFPNQIAVQHAGMYPFRKTDGEIYNYHFYKFFNVAYPEISTSTVPMVTGAALAIRKDHLEELGGLDTNYLGAAGFDDSDLCNSVRQRGKEIVFSKESELIHYEGTTVKHLSRTQQWLYAHNHQYYQHKWTQYLESEYPEYV